MLAAVARELTSFVKLAVHKSLSAFLKKRGITLPC